MRFLIPLLSLLVLASCKPQSVSINTFDPSLNNPALESFLHSSGTAEKSIFTSKNDVLHYTRFRMGDSSVDAYVQDQIKLIEALYQSHETPYRGAVSVSVVCPAEFQPVKKEGDDTAKKYIAIKMFANSRLIFGSCTPEQKKFQAFYIFIYCKNLGLGYELKLFHDAVEAPLDFDGLLSGFVCKPPPA